MRRGLRAVALSLTLATATTGCYGSFQLFHKVHKWNGTIGDKWINSVFHAVFWIVPLYQLVLLGDLVIFNTIEFWTGGNPVNQANIQVEDDGTVVVHAGDSVFRFQAADGEIRVMKDGVLVGQAERRDEGWVLYDLDSGRTVTLDEETSRRLEQTADRWQRGAPLLAEAR